MYVDYCTLNGNIVADIWPLLCIVELLSRLGGAS